MTSVNIVRTYLKTPFLFLLVIEFGVIYGLVFSAAYIRFYAWEGYFERIADTLWHGALTIAVITPVMMLATGLYQGQIREGLAGILLRILIAFVASASLVLLIAYFVPQLWLGHEVLILIYLQSFFVIGTIRAVFLEVVDTSTFKKRVLVYGAGKTAAQIDSKLRRKSDRRGFDIVGYILIDDQELMVDESKLVDFGASLRSYSKEHNIDEIVVATSDVNRVLRIDDLVNCKLNGITILDILSFFEREAGQVRIDIMDPTWLVTSEGFQQSRLRDVIKRTFDIFSSLIVLVLTMPFILLTIIAIWIEDGFGAPVFYSQIRVGKNGTHYKVYKLRSMRTDAEEVGKAVWASKNDSRVTRVGSFIRKSRIDEFPQLWNVLNGSMSFVGPRPERPQFVDELENEIPYYLERHLVKPGITGWAQLLYPYGSSVKDAYQKQLYDMYYVKNHSIFLDCLILLQTVEVILFGKGAR